MIISLPRYTRSLYCLLLVLVGCSGIPDDQERNQVTTVYCDSYMTYDMCAEDLNRDGTVDILYFNDTFEVMMYWEPTQALIPVDKPLHPCVQLMDQGMKDSNSESFYLDDKSDFFTVTNIRTRIMLSFAHFWPDVNHCNNQLADNNAVTDESFGEDFPEDF